jgi:hypothetical protein
MKFEMTLIEFFPQMRQISNGKIRIRLHGLFNLIIQFLPDILRHKICSCIATFKIQPKLVIQIVFISFVICCCLIYKIIKAMNDTNNEGWLYFLALFLLRLSNTRIVF